MHISLKSLLHTPEGYLFDNQSLKALIIPLVIEQILSIAVGAADTMMVASAGEAAVSAVSLVDNIFILLICLFAALATGGAVVSGQYLGRKRPDVARKAAEQLILFTAVFSALIMTLTYFSRYFLLNVVFGQIEADGMDGCTNYRMIVGASIPCIALYNTGAALFRAMGDSRTAMFTALFMNGINLIGNSILIYGLKLGVAGAAIPTLVSRIAAAALILALLRNPQKVIHVPIPFPLHFDFPLLKKILEIGIPNGLESSMFQLGKILVLSMVSGFGTASIAANAVSNTIGQFQILSGSAIGLAVLTVVARCVGAGSYEQVRYYTRKLMLVTYCTNIAVNLLVLAALPYFIRLYNLSPEAAGYVDDIIFYHAFCVMTVWPLSFNLPNTLRAASDVKYPMLLSIVSMWVFRIYFSWILGVQLGFGVFGIWVAMTIDWLFRAICFTLRYRGHRWEHHA